VSKQNSGIPAGVLPMTVLDHMVSSGVAALVVSLCILLHYEALNGLERLSRILKRHRWIVLITMFGLIVSHIAQIWVFAFGYYAAEHWLALGNVHGRAGESAEWMDYVYYSAVVFTTLGFGDMVPVAGLRMLTTSEALAGFSLISWSASFTFLQMQRVWRDRADT
jgi:hypothetical protein